MIRIFSRFSTLCLILSGGASTAHPSYSEPHHLTVSSDTKSIAIETSNKKNDGNDKNSLVPSSLFRKAKKGFFILHIILSFPSFFLLLVSNDFAGVLSSKELENQLNALTVSKSSIHEKICSIPADDLKQLKGLFDYLFLRHVFAYTLFGDKPMSYDVALYESDGLLKGSKYQFSLWKKYVHLFPSKNYLFLFCECNQDQNDKFEMTLINKKALSEVFEKHREKFIEVFGEDITAGKLLNLLMEKKSPWNTPMKDRDDLIGILFGYGKINAELYQRREELEKMQSNKEIYKKRPAPLKEWIKKIQTVPFPGYASTQDELNDIEDRLSVCHQDNVQLKVMGLPRFAADHTHPETIALINKYKHQRRNIIKKYGNRCVLETTLEKLCDEAENR